MRLGAASCARPWVPRPARGPGCRVPRVPGCRVPRVPGCPALRAFWVPRPARVPGCRALRASLGAASCARPWVPRPARVHGRRVLRAPLGAPPCARLWVPRPARVPGCRILRASLGAASCARPFEAGHALLHAWVAAGSAQGDYLGDNLVCMLKDSIMLASVKLCSMREPYRDYLSSKYKWGSHTGEDDTSIPQALVSHFASLNLEEQLNNVGCLVTCRKSRWCCLRGCRSCSSTVRRASQSA